RRRQRGRPAAEVDALELRREQRPLELELRQQRGDVALVLAVAADDGDEVAVAAAGRAERQVDVEMARAGHDATRRGRGTSSPPQLGQTPSIDSVHVTQNVHS